MKSGFQKGHPNFTKWGKGRKHTEESKKKIGNAKRGFKHTKKTREKITETLKNLWENGGRKGGWKHSKEWKEIMSKKMKGRVSPMKGKKWKDGQEERFLESMKKTYDEKGRKGYENCYHPTGLKKYKEWRMAVFMRDNFTCQFCGARGVYLNAHHIRSWVKYKKLRYVVENGVTLCEECHRLTHKKN